MEEISHVEMMTSAGIVGLVFSILLIVWVLMLLPKIFYLITLQNALSRCRPESRTLSPGLVWLLLVPLFGIIWHFFIVTGLSDSLTREFAARGTSMPGDQGRSAGLAMCILNVCAFIPYLGGLCVLAGFVCWILYWVRIAECSSQLLRAPI